MCADLMMLDVATLRNAIRASLADGIALNSVRSLHSSMCASVDASLVSHIAQVPVSRSSVWPSCYLKSMYSHCVVMQINGETSFVCRVICMNCQRITPREDFQRQLEGLNPEAANAIKRMVEAEQQLKKRRGPLHPSTEEEIMQAAEVQLCVPHIVAD